MFSMFLTRRASLCKFIGKSRIWRNTSQRTNAPRREQNDSSLTLALILGISGPVCYCGYSYATDKLFHENMDEKYVYQWPWLYKRLNKWFPIEVDSPFGLRRLNVPMELKETLAEAFTELDLALEDGVKRSDAIEFMQTLLESTVPKKYIKCLESGEYLDKCMKTVRRPELVASAGLDCVMSVDEFVAFAGAVMVNMTFSIPTLCLKVRVARDEYISSKHLHIPSTCRQGNVDEVLTTPDYTPQGMPFVRMEINSRYPMDQEVIDKYNSKKKAEKERNERKEELTTSIGVMQWELDQMYTELKELNAMKNDNETYKQHTSQLNSDIQLIRKQIAEAKSELSKL